MKKKIKTEGKYIINEKGEVVPCSDLLEWAEWMEHSKLRFIASDVVGEYRVSTIFLGLDYSFTGGKPILFETMVFETKLSTNTLGGKKYNFHKDIADFQERYSTKDEALAGHKETVEEVKKYERI